MKLHFPLAIASCIAAFSLSAQTTTTTFTQSVKMNDSLKVVKNISSLGDITATGEIISKDTMRAQKDVLVDGNAVIDGNLKVAGKARLIGGVNVGNLTLLPPPTLPCGMTSLMLASTGELVSLNNVDALNLEASLLSDPCSVPVIPFTWQTGGNHVNNNSRWIGTIENFDFNIRTNATQRMVVKNNGDIGVGAFGGMPYTGANSKYRIHVNGISGDVGIGAATISAATPKYFMRVVATTGDIVMGLLGAPLDIPVYRFKVDGTTSDVIVGDINNNSHFIIKANGNVGIGTKLTNNPNNYKLAVNGMIGAKEMKIEINSTTWADFVFEKNYTLMPLKDVEAYITKNKHLPNVPTVADVEANNGIEIGKTQTLLLQKIEELTLYLINESKRIEKLEQENALLKKQISGTK
jgi:hypothetical protein